MANTIPDKEPTEAIAGDSLQWDRSVSAFPPSEGWTLTYSLTGAHASVLTITASASGDGDYYEVRVTPDTTVGYTPGPYTLYGRVSNGTDKHNVYAGPLVVLADPATATPELSFNERMLALAETKLADRLTADISSYSLEQQEVHREELASLQKQRNAYAEAVRRERGGGFFQNVKVRLGAAS